jgi:hypothetical protein
MNEKPSKTGSRFFDWLFNTDGHPGLYILKMWPVQTIPSLVIIISSYYVAKLLGFQELFHLKHSSTTLSLPVRFFGTVIFSPAIETLLMIPLFGLLRGITKNQLALVFLSALVWALLHSILIPIWGLGVFWGFVVLSSSYLAWSDKSPKLAYWVTFALHALNNLTAFVGAVISATIA